MSEVEYVAEEVINEGGSWSAWVEGSDGTSGHGYGDCRASAIRAAIDEAKGDPARAERERRKRLEAERRYLEDNDMLDMY